MRMNHLLIPPIVILLIAIFIPLTGAAEESLQIEFHKERETNIQLLDTKERMKRFAFVSPYTFEYPDAVRGIYVTGQSAGSSNFSQLVELVESTDLNAMVIDIKDDFGYLTFEPEKGSPFGEISKNYIQDPQKLMGTLEEKEIYPIARIVVFKDTVLAKQRPEYSFTENGKVWTNN